MHPQGERQKSADKIYGIASHLAPSKDLHVRALQNNLPAQYAMRLGKNGSIRARPQVQGLEDFSLHLRPRPEIKRVLVRKSIPSYC
jgi:hypothetical protein